MTDDRLSMDDGILLWAMLAYPKGTFRQWCRAMAWVTAKGEQVSRVQNTLARLHSARLVRRYRGKWVVLKSPKTAASDD